MSGGMLLRSRTTLRWFTVLGALTALLLMEGATGARAASESANSVLFGKPNTVHSTTPAPRSSTPASARPQTGTTKTTTAVTRTQAAPGFSTPHIATTTPQPDTPKAGAGTPGGVTSPSTPTTSTNPALGTPGTGTNPATGAPATGAVPGVAGSPASGTTTPGTGTTPGSAAGLAPGRTPTLKPVTHERTSLSSTAIVAAALAALLILICLVWGLARWYAYEPHWTVSLRHSFAEAGLRMSATWEELADWSRLGR
jgi:hypothetical protein